MSRSEAFGVELARDSWAGNTDLVYVDRSPAGNLILAALDRERVKVAHVVLTPAEWRRMRAEADRRAGTQSLDLSDAEVRTLCGALLNERKRLGRGPQTEGIRAQCERLAALEERLMALGSEG